MNKGLVIAALLAALPVPPATTARGVELFLEGRISVGPEKITALAFGPDAETIAFGDRSGAIYLVDVADREPRTVFQGPGREITVLAFSPDGRYIAVAARGKGVWLLERPREAGDVQPAGGDADRGRFGEGAGRGLSRGEWSAVELKGAAGRAAALAFSGDGRHLAAGGDRKDILVWEIPSGQLRSKLKGHGKEVLALAFDDAERRIISVAKDGRMIIWDAPSMRPLRRYDLEAGTMAGAAVDVTAARVSGDRLFVAAAVDEHILRKGGREMIFKYHIAFFDVSKGVLLKVLEDNNRKIERLALYQGNCFVAFDNSTLQNKSIALRNIESGSLDLSYALERDCENLEFSPDGRWLAGAVETTGGGGSELYLWSVEYEIPASGCFMSRIRLVSAAEPLIGPQGWPASIGRREPSTSPGIAAVVPFAATGTDADLGRAAAHFMESRLADSPHLRLIERSRVDEIIRELEFQRSGLIDPSTAVEMGRLLGARLMITGSIDRTGADLVLSARIIHVETGEILGTRQVHCGQCGADDIFDAIDLLGDALVGKGRNRP